jgi:Phospholipase_D-nuclease N-terminal/Short C-terminal domain
MLYASTYGVGQFVYSILWFFLFLIEIWLIFSVFVDIFRSHDLKGWQKALWVLFVLVIPLIGILAYFIFRGDKMRAHQVQAQQFYGGPGWSAGSSPADQLSRLADLRRDGIITESEFQELKSRIMRQDADARSGQP